MSSILESGRKVIVVSLDWTGRTYSLYITKDSRVFAQSRGQHVVHKVRAVFEEADTGRYVKVILNS